VLLIDELDRTDEPFEAYLLEVLGSGIIRDMVMDVLLEKKEPMVAAERGQKRLEELLKSKGYWKG